jgi:Superinfection immunity protein
MQPEIGTLIALLPLVAIFLLIYFIPTIIAFKCQHQQWPAILILNLFLGWTYVGWVAALVWAFITTGGTDVTRWHAQRTQILTLTKEHGQ